MLLLHLRCSAHCADIVAIRDESMKNQIRFHVLGLAVAGTVCGTNAFALEPQKIKLADSVELTPTLMVKETYDDNIYADDRHEVSSWVTTIAPTLKLSAQGNKAGYDVTYSAVSDTFHSAHGDDNADHHLTANAGLQFDARNHLSVQGGYHRTEYIDSDSTTSQSDKKALATAGAVYSYGVSDAPGRIEVAGKYDSVRYENSGHLNAYREYDSPSARGAFYYRLSPKTRLLVEGRYADFDYLTNDALDSTSTAGLLGAQWFATAATSGSIKVGRERKNYDDASVDDQSNGMWEASVDWTPLSYSTVSFSTAQRIDEGIDGATAIDVREYGVSWKHAWSSRLKTEAGYQYLNKDYQSAVREDDRDIFKLEASYALLRWLDVGVGYRAESNSSNVAGEDYDRNIYYVSLTGSL